MMEHPLFLAACLVLSFFFGGIAGILRRETPVADIHLTRAGTAGLEFEALRAKCTCSGWELKLALVALINKRKAGWDFSDQDRMRIPGFPYPFPWDFQRCTFWTVHDGNGHWDAMLCAAGAA